MTSLMNIGPLSEQNKRDLVAVTYTEIDPRLEPLDPEQYRMQIAAVVDTILNRLASDDYPNTVRQVANQDRQFTAINGPDDKRTPEYDRDVRNVPWEDIPEEFVEMVYAHIAAREAGKRSVVGGHLNYANVDQSAGQTWLQELDGPVFGADLYVHHHGTASHLRPIEAVLTPVTREVPLPPRDPRLPFVQDLRQTPSTWEFPGFTPLDPNNIPDEMFSPEMAYPLGSPMPDGYRFKVLRGMLGDPIPPDPAPRPEWLDERPASTSGPNGDPIPPTPAPRPAWRDNRVALNAGAPSDPVAAAMLQNRFGQPGAGGGVTAMAYWPEDGTGGGQVTGQVRGQATGQVPLPRPRPEGLGDGGGQGAGGPFGDYPGYGVEIEWGGYDENLRPELIEVLNRAQTQLPFPIHLNSGYRTETQNRIAGGVPNSQHRKGNAVDISVRGLEEAQRALLVQALAQAGALRLIAYGDREIVHADMATGYEAQPEYSVYAMYDSAAENMHAAPAWFKMGLHPQGNLTAEAPIPARMPLGLRGATPPSAREFPGFVPLDPRNIPDAMFSPETVYPAGYFNLGALIEPGETAPPLPRPRPEQAVGTPPQTGFGGTPSMLSPGGPAPELTAPSLDSGMLFSGPSPSAGTFTPRRASDPGSLSQTRIPALPTMSFEDFSFDPLIEQIEIPSDAFSPPDASDFGFDQDMFGLPDDDEDGVPDLMGMGPAVRADDPVAAAMLQKRFGKPEAQSPRMMAYRPEGGTGSGQVMGQVRGQAAEQATGQPAGDARPTMSETFRDLSDSGVMIDPNSILVMRKNILTRIGDAALDGEMSPGAAAALDDLTAMADELSSGTTPGISPSRLEAFVNTALQAVQSGDVPDLELADIVVDEFDNMMQRLVPDNLLVAPGDDPARRLEQMRDPMLPGTVAETTPPLELAQPPQPVETGWPGAGQGPGGAPNIHPSMLPEINTDLLSAPPPVPATGEGDQGFLPWMASSAWDAFIGDERGGAIDPLLHGVSLGWSDELAGIGGGLWTLVNGGDFWEGQSQTQEQARARLEGYKEDNPYLAAGLEFGGGLVTTAIPVVGAARNAGLAAKLLQGIRTGAIEGAITKAGEANGDVWERLEGAIRGAAEGAVTGGVASGAADLASRGWDRLRRLVPDSAARRAFGMFDEADNAGVMISDSRYMSMLAEFRTALRNAGWDATVDPQGAGVVKELMGVANNLSSGAAGVSLSDLHALRHSAWLLGQLGEAHDRGFSNLLVHTIDDMIPRLKSYDLLVASGEDAAQWLQRAPGIWHNALTMRQNEKFVEFLAENAVDAGPEFWGAAWQAYKNAHQYDDFLQPPREPQVRGTPGATGGLIAEQAADSYIPIPYDGYGALAEMIRRRGVRELGKSMEPADKDVPPNLLLNGFASLGLNPVPALSVDRMPPGVPIPALDANGQVAFDGPSDMRLALPGHDRVPPSAAPGNGQVPPPGTGFPYYTETPDRLMDQYRLSQVPGYPMAQPTHNEKMAEALMGEVHPYTYGANEGQIPIEQPPSTIPPDHNELRAEELMAGGVMGAPAGVSGPGTISAQTRLPAVQANTIEPGSDMGAAKTIAVLPAMATTAPVATPVPVAAAMPALFTPSAPSPGFGFGALFASRRPNTVVNTSYGPRNVGDKVGGYTVSSNDWFNRIRGIGGPSLSTSGFTPAGYRWGGRVQGVSGHRGRGFG